MQHFHSLIASQSAVSPVHDLIANQSFKNLNLKISQPPASGFSQFPRTLPTYLPPRCPRWTEIMKLWYLLPKSVELSLRGSVAAISLMVANN